MSTTPSPDLEAGGAAVLSDADAQILPAVEPIAAENVVLTPFSSAVAAIAILAATRLNDRFADESDNEAQRQADGSVRLSLKQREGGHLRVYVRIPETVDLIVVEAPYPTSPE